MFKKISMFLILALLAGCASAPMEPMEHTLVILHTNDFHGHPLKFYDYPASDVGGLPAIATFVKQVRNEYENVLLADAGDINTGRPESNFFKAEPVILGYNYIGYDVMALGNHEFDNSREVLKQQMDLADFPFISANIKTSDGAYLTKPYIIKEYPGFKVGIIGLTTRETKTIGSPDYIGDLVFEDEVVAARHFVSVLEEEGVDVIIVLGHLGIYPSLDEGSLRLAREVEGLDLIIDGHSHTFLDEPLVENGVPIVQARQWGLYVGEGIMTIEDGEVTSFEWKPVPVNLQKQIKKEDGSKGFEPLGEMYSDDPELQALLTPYVEEVETKLNVEIGKATATFFNADVRKAETALGDMVADSMVWYTENLGVDFAVQNGGGIRADLPEGVIRKKMIYEILPFDNSVYVLKLSGQKVQELFDYIASIPPGKGSFPQVSDGVSFTINYTTGKCENILIQGKPLDLSGEYTIATNSYMAAGGDGYSVFTDATYTYDTSAFQRDAFIDYVIAIGGTITPENHGRITRIGASE